MAVRVAEVGKKVKTKGEGKRYRSSFNLLIFQRGRILDRYGVRGFVPANPLTWNGRSAPHCILC
jgi:hypothetical protein